MISLLEIANSIDEAKMKLKPKDGGKIVTFTDKDNYEDALKSGDYEEPEGSKKVKSKGSDIDFDRAADDDADDMDRDARFDADAEDGEPKGEPKTKNKFGVSDDQYIGQTDGPFNQQDVTVKQALAYDGDNSTMNFYKRKAQGLMDDGDFEAYGIDPNHPKGGSPNAKAAEPKDEPKDEPKGKLSPKAQAAVDELEDLYDPDEIESWIYDYQFYLRKGRIGNVGQMNVDKFVRKFRDLEDTYRDDEDKYYDTTLPAFKDMINKTMDRYRKKSESIKVIDGKKYKAIKESKKNPRILKEIYERTFRSLK